MRKPTEIDITGKVTNIGRPDGTTRDTWHAVFTARAPLSAGGCARACGAGKGKSPEVALRRATDDAVSEVLKRTR